MFARTLGLAVLNFSDKKQIVEFKISDWGDKPIFFFKMGLWGYLLAVVIPNRANIILQFQQDFVFERVVEVLPKTENMKDYMDKQMVK